MVLRLRGSGRALGASGSARPETVGEAAGDVLEMSHAAGAGGLPALGLLSPVDYITVNRCSREGGRRASQDIHLRVLAAGYPHEEQVCFWIWRERRPVSFPVSPSRPNIPSL